jgi:hypothetical protein
MIYDTNQKVEVGELIMQPFIESLRLHDINSKENTVGWRSRASYNNESGLITRTGRKGKITKRLQLDARFDDNWYEVYLNTSTSMYAWINFHESELIPLNNLGHRLYEIGKPKPNPIFNWLKTKK